MAGEHDVDRRPVSDRGAGGGQGSGPPALTLSGITKHFGLSRVLDDVGLEVRDGEVLALLGENGAGKTTLMRITSGLETRDRGTVTVRGEEHPVGSPAEALGLGIAMVHQHFSLIGNLSVAENVVLGRRGMSLQPLRKRAARAEVERVAAEYSIELGVSRRVDTLSVDDQAKVELVKALYLGAKILILDEPTSSLGPKQIDDLFATVARMVASGVAVVLVSHRLGEIKEISDHVVVLRNGRVTESGLTASFGEAELTRAMVGQELAPIRVGNGTQATEVAPEARLVVRDLEAVVDGTAKLAGVSFDAVAGRVLGVVGVEGNGQAELLEVLAGLRHPSGGQVLLDGDDVAGLSPLELHRRAMVAISGDRQRWDIVPGLSQAENLALHAIAAGSYRTRTGLISWRAVEADAERLADTFDIRPRQVGQRIERFSGGNQQKTVIARALSQRPRVLVLGQPTRGLDVGARRFVHNEVLAARDAGVAIVLVSFDLDELFDLADDVIVLFRGRISYTATRADASLADVGAAMAGVAMGAASTSSAGPG